MTSESLEIVLKKSPIPVLWFDTSFVWSKSTDIQFWQKLAKLSLENKIMVVDTGQYAEMVERFANSSVTPNENSLVTLSIYKDIVGRYFSIDHNSFLSRQIKIAMNAYAKKEKQIMYSFSDLFDDLIRSLTCNLDEQNMYLSGKYGTPRSFKRLSMDIVNDWEAIREIAKSKKQSYEERLELELHGMHDVLLNVANSTDEIKKRNLVYSYLVKYPIF